MLPKKLHMENFGPFLDETVDFERLQEAPLFLISGKTGAGKTTIFDAITFALFGDVSGGVRNINEVRSLFAKASAVTKVSFSFWQQGRLYQIERTPKQTVAKKNGTGTTTKNQKVQLIVFDELGKEVEAYTKIERVNSVLFELLHLQKEQFRQIVMLPQGEFRNFLMANSSEKETLLRSLFGTDFYRTFTDNLKNQRKEMAAATQELTTRIDQLFEQIKIEPRESFATNLAAAEEYLITHEKQLVQQKEVVTKKEAVLAEKQLKLNQGQQLAEAFEQYQTAQTQAAELKSQVAEMTQLAETLALAEKVQQLQPLQSKQIQSEKSLQELKDQQQETQTAIQKNQNQYQDWEKQQAEMAAEESRWQQQAKKLQQLENMQPLVMEQQKLTQQAAELTEKITTEAQQINHLTAKLTVVQDQLGILQNSLTEEDSWQERRFNEERFKEKLQNIMLLQEKEFQLQEQEDDEQIFLAKITAKMSQQSQVLTEESNLFAALKSRWASLEIARLSMALLPGEPCPVCGSLEHPTPASHEEVQSAELTALQNQVEEKEQLLEKLKIEREKNQGIYDTKKVSFDSLQTQRETLQVELSQLTETLTASLAKAYQSEVTDVAAFLAEKRKETKKALAKIQENKANLATKTAALAEEQKQLTQLQNQQQISQNQLENIQGSLTILTKQTEGWQATELIAEIQKLTQSIKEFQEKIQSHRELERQLLQKKDQLTERLTLLAQQQEKMQAEVKKTQQDFTTALQQADLNETDFQAGQAMEINSAELKAQLQNYQTQQLLVKDRLQQLKVKIKEQQLPDLDSLTAAVETSSIELKEQQQIFYEIENDLKQQGALLQKINSYHTENQGQLQQLAEISQLFETMNGDNPEKISLERYVLKWHLTEVLQQANLQLNQLTNGRYQFELKTERGSSKGSTGLEINVYDDNAGSSRSAQTLSGGESFIAALSLALGLAEVIQNQSGGVSVETLFIDEGFGSLDEEALEMAMNALEGVESQGRMIGIISHVKELKERILQQIIVQTTGSGESTITYLEEGSDGR